VVVLIAGALQFTDGRRVTSPTAGGARARPCLPADAGTACGTAYLGLHCAAAVSSDGDLLVIGVMDLGAMAVVAGHHGRRLAPAGARVARATGVVAVGPGCF